MTFYGNCKIVGIGLCTRFAPIVELFGTQSLINIFDLVYNFTYTRSTAIQPANKFEINRFIRLKFRTKQLNCSILVICAAVNTFEFIIIDERSLNIKCLMGCVYRPRHLNRKSII